MVELEFSMADLLSWTRCPFCGESTDLNRIGKPLTVYVKTNEKLGTKTSRTVQCGYCKKTFQTDSPTMLEAMGYDGENETPY